MIRAFAIASAIVTQRFIMIPTLMALGTEDAVIRWTSMLSFTIAFVVHSVIAEIWIVVRKSERETFGGGAPMT